MFISPVDFFGTAYANVPAQILHRFSSSLMLAIFDADTQWRASDITADAVAGTMPMLAHNSYFMRGRRAAAAV